MHVLDLPWYSLPFSHVLQIVISLILTRWGTEDAQLFFIFQHDGHVWTYLICLSDRDQVWAFIDTHTNPLSLILPKTNDCSWCFKSFIMRCLSNLEMREIKFIQNFQKLFVTIFRKILLERSIFAARWLYVHFCRIFQSILWIIIVQLTYDRQTRLYEIIVHVDILMYTKDQRELDIFYVESCRNFGLRTVASQWAAERRTFREFTKCCRWTSQLYSRT